jgi:hypothetical protein
VAGLLSAWISIPHVTFPLLFWNWIDLEMGAAVAAGASAATHAATVETASAANRFMLSPRDRLPRLRLQFEPLRGFIRTVAVKVEVLDVGAVVVCPGRSLVLLIELGPAPRSRFAAGTLDLV